MMSQPASRYRYRSVVPDLPSPSEYLPLLEEMHARGWYSNFGPLARRLEARLLDWLGAPGETCVSSANATAGLSAALLASGRSGSVLIPAFTFPASLGAVRAAGMTPIVVDVEPASWALGGAALERALAETGARAVMIVAPFGSARDWSAEIETCRRAGAALVIDNASGLGIPRPSAGGGEDFFEVFSMHATKPFGVGEGGVVFADATRDRSLRDALNFALDAARGAGPDWGFNGKMSELHAAVGLAQCARFEASLGRRQAMAAAYRDGLAAFSGPVFPRDPSIAPWQFFPVLLPSAPATARCVAAAAAAGVEIRRYYRPSLSRWPGAACPAGCPVAEDLAERMCALPIRAAANGSVDDLIGRVLAALDLALQRA